MTISLVVHACPPGDVRGVLNVIDTWQLNDNGQPDGDRITLGLAYENWTTGSPAGEVHADLLKAAPGATWTVEGPADSEYLGDVWVRVPGLGCWTAEIGPGSQQLYTEEELEAACSMTPEDRARFLGRPWREAIAALPDTDTEPGTDVVVPRSFDVTWDRQTGEIVVYAAADDDEELALPTITPQTTGEPDFEPAEQALQTAGFVRADIWLAAGRGRIQETEVYRLADAHPQPRTAENTWQQLDRIARQQGEQR